MVEIPDIDRLMAGPLGSFLHDQQAERRAAKRQAWNRGRTALLVGGSLAMLFMIFVPFDTTPKLWAIGFAASIVAAWVWKPIAAAKRRVKIGINEGIAQALGFTYAHDGEKGREYRLAEQFGLLPDSDRSCVEDFWTGQLGDHDFHLHEAHLEERRGSGKNRRWVTVFRGAIIRIGSGRRFHGITLLQRAGRHKSWFGFGGRRDHVDFDGHRLHSVDMVHPRFDDAFEVWSDDQVEARYLVDPVYVERLLELEREFEGKDVCSLFVDGDIIVAVKSGNLFEGGTMDPHSDRFMVEKCARQFASMGQLAKSVQTDFGFTR